MKARAWFSREGEPARPWRLRYEDGRTTLAASVQFSTAATQYKADGFADLPDGPKAVLVGTLVGVTDEAPCL